MRLELTALAASDYDNIIDHSLAEFGNVAALAYVDAVEAAFRQLTEYPLSGRAETSLHPDARSVGCQSHRIYYSVDDQQIVIRRILHKSMDARNWLG